MDEPTNPPQLSVASLIYFTDGVSKERVDRWVAKLVEQGYARRADTREYDGSHGEGPCWYIP